MKMLTHQQILTCREISIGIEKKRRDVENLINATPTGESRNKLTDINIMLMQAARELEQIK